ncbi:MAG: FecR family protein [Sphingobacterium sp.]
MSENRMHAIFDRFLRGKASPTDLQILLDYFQDSDTECLKERIRSALEKEESTRAIRTRQSVVDRVHIALVKKRVFELQAKIKDGSRSNQEVEELHRHVEQYGLDDISRDIYPVHSPPSTSERFEIRPRRSPFLTARRLLMTGVVMLFGLIGALWFLRIDTPLRTSAPWSHEVSLPKNNEARIVFGDGTSISVLQGDPDLLSDRGIEIIEFPNQEVVFKIKSSLDRKLSYNTFISPKGNASHLILPDGSHVWLNSNSQLTYPSLFSDAKRTVELNGEAYFDVYHNPNSPFTVAAEGTEVTALGTAFNVATNRSQDDVLTTLISGSVSVGTDRRRILIHPGMQSASNKHNGDIRSYDIETWNEIAWKAGFFKFNNDDIHTVLDKLSAWYEIRNIEIRGETTDRFSGTLKRTRKLSELLESLEEISSYKFTIKDGRIIVMK